MIDYQGRGALVTGGASGIGRALAEALAARGARVAVADIDLAGATRVADEIGGVAIASDLSVSGAAIELLAAAQAALGPIDIVCSNAGLGRNRRLLKEDFDDPAVAALFQLNLFSGMQLAQAYIRECEQSQRRGRLMWTGSENSLSVPDAVRTSGLGVYGATKHALLIMAEWLRSEALAAAKPIDLHILCPGGVLTPPIAAMLPDPTDPPAGFHLITPERCAELALAGIDAGLFLIATHPHIADDMAVRHAEVQTALSTLGLTD